jgi:hypothetical protein
MRHTVGYLPPLVAFVAMFVGLLGPSRYADKAGLSAITPFGWASCAIAAISLLVATYLQYRKNVEIDTALASQQRMRSVVNRELREGVTSLYDVLRYAALMPYTTTSLTTPDAPKDIPYPAYLKSHMAFDIDLRSREVVSVLEQLYLSPAATMRAPYIPSAVPFGTQVARSCMTVLVEESSAAARRIESAVQKYAAVALTPEVISAGSELVTAPFLKHLMELRENWANRSSMEESESPVSLNFRFLNSGLSGGYTQQYLDLLDRMDRLSARLDAVK